MKQSRFCLFLFAMIYNYMFLRSILFPYCYKNYGYNGIWIIFLILIIVVFMLMIFPKKIYNTDYFNSYKKSKIKYIINSILFLRVILGISISSIIIYNLFFYDYSFYLIPFAFILVLLLISKLKPKEVLELNTLFSLVTLFLYSFYLYDFIDLDFYSIKKKFDFSLNFNVFLLSICMIFDNLLILLSNDKQVKSKKAIFISGIFASIISVLFEYALLVLSAGDYIFINEKFIGFITLTIEPVSRYNGNFDYVYILFLGIGTVFKFSYLFSLFRNSINLKFSIPKLIITFLIIFLLCITIYLVYEFVNIYSIVVLLLLITGLSLLIWILKECYYAKKA